MSDEASDLRQIIKKLKTENETLRIENDNLKAENDCLNERVIDLEACE